MTERQIEGQTDVHKDGHFELWNSFVFKEKQKFTDDFIQFKPKTFFVQAKCLQLSNMHLLSADTIKGTL